MPGEKFGKRHRIAGMAASWATSALLVVYGITLILGLISLKSPNDPIADPYFTLMELLIVLIMPIMVLVMAALHYYSSPESSLYSLMALIMMAIAAVITSSVHFVILTVSRHAEMAAMPWTSFLLSFKWPSIAYTLDILAWDWFFALSMLFAAPIFKSGRLEIAVRSLMIVSGLLSLAGLIGVPLADMQIRMIGVIGYAVVTPFLFLFLGIVFKCSMDRTL
ncbi:hypothetical protein F9K33_16375 [bacterium]|nr:MAG: hypothetical protein F9K33_16375 [bacterium]